MKKNRPTLPKESGRSAAEPTPARSLSLASDESFRKALRARMASPSGKEDIKRLSEIVAFRAIEEVIAALEEFCERAGSDPIAELRQFLKRLKLPRQ